MGFLFKHEQEVQNPDIAGGGIEKLCNLLLDFTYFYTLTSNTVSRGVGGIFF